MRMQLEFPKEGSGNTERKHDPQVYRGDENFKAAEAVSSANPTSENLKTAARTSPPRRERETANPGKRIQAHALPICKKLRLPHRALG